MKNKFDAWEEFKEELKHRKYPYSKRNWGHRLHSLCSFQGKMKPSLVFHLINTFSKKKEHILDPFCGSGTTLFEASLNGRKTTGFDISKIAVSIAHAKINLFDQKRVFEIINKLEKFVNKNSTISKKTIKDVTEVKFNKKIQDYYEKETLNEILKSRDFFLKYFDTKSPEWCLVFSSMLHILHGNRPYALSRRSHPLTPYAPAGKFLRKPLIKHLKAKVEMCLKFEKGKDFISGNAFHQNILDKWKLKNNSINLIITSPPFANSTRFYMTNWIRFWYAGWGLKDFSSESEYYVENKQKVSFDCYDFIFKESKRVLKKNSLMVMHLGLNKKTNMGEEIIPYAEKYFYVHDLFNETVEHCEKHGIKDKGGIKEHQYLVLQKL